MPVSTSSNKRRRGPKNNPNLYKVTALSGIGFIKPKLHWIALSGNANSYSRILTELGGIFPGPRPITRPDRKQYNRWGYIGGGQYIIYWWPKEGHFDYFMLATSNSTPEELWDLYGKVGDLKISSVEYTIDFFCKGPEAVNNLYFLFRRYSYFPNKTKVRFLGGHFDGWNEPREENSVYHIGQDIKIYERGPDRAKIKGGGWKYEKVNRVRFEITLRRGGRGHNKLLIKHELDYLSDLLKDPKFGEVMLDKINFRAFDGRNINLLTEKEDYLNVTEDKQYKNRIQEVEKHVKKYHLGTLETFQVQYILAQHILNVRNPAQYMIEADGFKPLQNKIKTAVDKFEKKWAETIKKLEKTKPKEGKKNKNDWVLI